MRIFLSYHTPDEGLARGLKTAIEARDEGIEIFFAPEGLRAGSFWVLKLAEEIEEADAFLLLLGERTGDWQLLEYYEALDRRMREEAFPVVPVIVAKRPPVVLFLNQVHWIAATVPTAEPHVTKVIVAWPRKSRVRRSS